MPALTVLLLCAAEACPSCQLAVQVLIVGSETTENYAMQLFTPPYLTGTPNRPTILGLSSTSPGYGAQLSITFGSTQGAALNIQRVVLSRSGGVTHSQHFDLRQVPLLVLCCAATVLACKLGQLRCVVRLCAGLRRHHACFMWQLS